MQTIQPLSTTINRSTSKQSMDGLDNDNVENANKIENTTFNRIHHDIRHSCKYRGTDDEDFFEFLMTY